VQIGFELMTQRAWTILPGAYFSIAVLWNHVKIPSSIGKDVFHDAGMILPNKILTGTGRINYSSEDTTNRFEPLQALPCRLVQCPNDPPVDFRVDIAIPKASLVNTVYQSAFLKMWKRKESKTTHTVLYFDPQSVQNIQMNRFEIDLSHILTHGI